MFVLWTIFSYNRCGQETRVIPRILQLRSHWLKSEKESVRLEEAGITKDVMNDAIAQFCLEIIAKHGDPAPRLCNKDPLTLKMGSYVIELFPNAKFLFMVRDGRATVHSIISRKVTITGFDLTSYRQCLTKWNHAIQTMHDQCKEIGRERCMMVSWFYCFLNIFIKWISVDVMTKWNFGHDLNFVFTSFWCTFKYLFLLVFSIYFFVLFFGSCLSTKKN